MRILHLIPTLGGGGAERQITYLARGLRDRGCEVHVGMLVEGSNLGRLERAGAIVHRVAARGNYDPLLVLRIVRLIRHVRPDIVQTWLRQMDVFGGAASRLTGTPWVVSERSSGAHYPRDFRHALRRFVGRFADAVVANSKGGLTFWEHTDAAKFVVANALELEEIDAAPPEPLEDIHAPILLFAGRFDEEKNLPNMIDAMAEVARVRDVTVLLCGTGPLEAAVRERAHAAGLGPRVRFLGFTDRLWSLMKRADVLVAVSWFEGQPNVVLEAAASGCPLVLSDIPAHRSLLGEDGAVLAAPDDPRAVAASIHRVLDDPESARARAAHAKKIVRGLSISAAAEAYLRVYEHVLVSAPPEPHAIVHRH